MDCLWIMILVYWRLKVQLKIVMYLENVTYTVVNIMLFSDLLFFFRLFNFCKDQQYQINK